MMKNITIHGVRLTKFPRRDPIAGGRWARGTGKLGMPRSVPESAGIGAEVHRQLGGPEGLKICYMLGRQATRCTRQLTKMGIECEVVASSLIPRKPGDKVKTDRRDAEKLALCYQSGTLTRVWVPDAAHEAQVGPRPRAGG